MTYPELGTPNLGRGTTYLERGQGYQSFQLISCFRLQKNFGSEPQKKGNNVGFNLDTLDGTRVQRHPVLRLLCMSLVGPYSGLLLPS